MDMYVCEHVCRNILWYTCKGQRTMLLSWSLSFCAVKPPKRTQAKQAVFTAQRFSSLSFVICFTSFPILIYLCESIYMRIYDDMPTCIYILHVSTCYTQKPNIPWITDSSKTHHVFQTLTSSNQHQQLIYVLISDFMF